MISQCTAANFSFSCFRVIFTYSGVSIAVWYCHHLVQEEGGWLLRTRLVYKVCCRCILFALPYGITKTCLYNFDPLKPHFCIVKLGFTGVYIIFLFSAQKHRLWVLVRTIDCGYSLEPPRRCGSNEYPQSMFWAEIRKISGLLYLKLFIFMVVKFSVYLNRRVFVMSLDVCLVPI